MLGFDHDPLAKEVADLVFNRRWYMFKRNKLYRRYTNFIWVEITERIKEIIETTKAKTILIDAPLLIESGLDKICDTVIYVDTKFPLRLERAKARGWSVEELKRRDAFFIKTKGN